MKKTLVMIVCLLTIVGVANVSVAADKKVPSKAYLDQAQTPEDDSPPSTGCGLGWQITKKRTFLATTTRGTTDAFVPPSFGMTSGTIGCAKHDFAKNNVEATTYVVKNFENLRIEMAEGRGESLAALARTMGCSDAAVAHFGEMTRSQYETIMNDASRESPVQVLMNIDAAVKANASLSAACRG